MARKFGAAFDIVNVFVVKTYMYTVKEKGRRREEGGRGPREKHHRRFPHFQLATQRAAPACVYVHVLRASGYGFVCRCGWERQD